MTGNNKPHGNGDAIGNATKNPAIDEITLSHKEISKLLRIDKWKSLQITKASMIITPIIATPLDSTPINTGAMEPNIPQKIGLSASTGFSRSTIAPRKRRDTSIMRGIRFNRRPALHLLAPIAHSYNNTTMIIKMWTSSRLSPSSFRVAPFCLQKSGCTKHNNG